MFFLQNLTLRDNILFGLPYEETKYRQVRGYFVFGCVESAVHVPVKKNVYEQNEYS